MKQMEPSKSSGRSVNPLQPEEPVNPSYAYHPSDEEYTEALKTMERFGWVADYIITHCAPNSVVKKLNPDYDLDQLTAFLEKIRRKAKFHYWLFSHYHDNKIINERYVLLWEQIVPII